LGYLRIVQGDDTAARAYLNQSLSMYRELGITSDIAGFLPYLGMTALHPGEYQAARAAYMEGLTLSAEIGAKPSLAYNLAGWAALASAEGMAARAARLAGAAETLRASINITFGVGDRRLFERTIASAKESLGEAGFQSAWEAGAGMALEQAVAFALEKSGD
jgi:non-specific serine/threonine protein kinase